MGAIGPEFAEGYDTILPARDPERHGRTRRSPQFARPATRVIRVVDTVISNTDPNLQNTDHFNNGETSIAINPINSQGDRDQCLQRVLGQSAAQRAALAFDE